jgi:hypothetical protein
MEDAAEEVASFLVLEIEGKWKEMEDEAGRLCIWERRIPWLGKTINENENNISHF